MTGVGKIKAQINAAEKLLRYLGIFDERNEWVSYPLSLPGLVRPLSYVDEYRMYLNERLFDLSLVDHGLFQFKADIDDDISYCYYQAPFDAPTYKEFVAELLADESVNMDEVGDSFYDDYQHVIDTASLRKGVTPIRYDYSPKLYEAGVHPAAHVHIGSSTEIRLHTRRLMLPLSFVLFVLRQMYPEPWRRFIRGEESGTVCRCIRDDLELIDAEYSKDLDRLQLVLE